MWEISRIGKHACGTVTRLAKAAFQKAQLVHNQEFQAVDTAAVIANEQWSLVTIVRTVLAMELQGLQANRSSDCIFNSKLAFELTLN